MSFIWRLLREGPFPLPAQERTTQPIPHTPPQLARRPRRHSTPSTKVREQRASESRLSLPVVAPPAPFLAVAAHDHSSTSMLDLVKAILREERPANTSRAYDTYWQQWYQWCRDNGHSALPAEPEVLAYWLHWLVTGPRHLAPSTAALAASAVADGHKFADLPSPTKSWLVTAMHKVLRTKRQVPKVPQPPLRLNHVMRMAEEMDPARWIDVRDVTMFLVMLTCALRPSEAANLRVSDLTIEPLRIKGAVRKVLHVLVRRAKNDQEGDGHVRPVLQAPDERGYVCPVRAWNSWVSVVRNANSKLCGSEWAFPTETGTRLSKNTPNHLLKKWCVKQGIK